MMAEEIKLASDRMAEEIKLTPELSPEDLQPDICFNPHPLSWDRRKLDDQVGDPGWKNKFNWYMVMQVCLSVFYAIIYGISFTGLHPYYEWPAQLKVISNSTALCPGVKQITLESILTDTESFECKTTTFYLNETGPLFNYSLKEGDFKLISDSYCFNPDSLYFNTNDLNPTMTNKTKIIPPVIPPHPTTVNKTTVATPAIPHENITKVCMDSYNDKTSFRECMEYCSPGACCLSSSASNSCLDDNLETCELYSPCEILRNNSNSSAQILPPSLSYGSLTKICSETEIHNISDDDCWAVCSSAVCCFSSLVDSCLADNVETCKLYAPCKILTQGNRRTQIFSNTSSGETSLGDIIGDAFTFVFSKYNNLTTIDFESSTYNLLVHMGSYWGISIAYFVIFIIIRLCSGKYNQMILLVQFDQHEDEHGKTVKPVKLSVAYTIMCNAKSFSNIVFKDLCGMMATDDTDVISFIFLGAWVTLLLLVFFWIVTCCGKWECKCCCCCFTLPRQFLLFRVLIICNTVIMFITWIVNFSPNMQFNLNMPVLFSTNVISWLDFIVSLLGDIFYVYRKWQKIRKDPKYSKLSQKKLHV